MNFEVLDTNGNKIKCDVIGMFEHDNKKFIIYTDGTLVDNEQEVYASLYEVTNEKNIMLLPIIDDKDWDLVDAYLGEM